MTIEERANKFYYDAELEEDWCQEKCAEVGYIQGATDQKKIDIEKVCDWLHSNCYIDDKYMDMFKKAMEEI